MVLSTLDTEDNVEPNETRITPLSSELCIKVSNSAETGLGGLVRSGPTTLVSTNTIFFQHIDKHSKLINFCTHTMYYFSIVLYLHKHHFQRPKLLWLAMGVGVGIRRWNTKLVSVLSRRTLFMSQILCMETEKNGKARWWKFPRGGIFDPSFPQPPSHAWKT